MLIIRLNGCHHSTVPDGRESGERDGRGVTGEKEREKGVEDRESDTKREVRTVRKKGAREVHKEEEVEAEKEREKLASFNTSQTKGDFQRNVGRESRLMPEAHSRQISEGEREKK